MKEQVVVMQNNKKLVGIGVAAEILEVSENTLRNNEVVAEDGNRYLVKGDFKIRVYFTIGGQRRYLEEDIRVIKYL
jgi:hypothetical protein